MAKKLFVGGLSWATNDESLRKAFEPFCLLVFTDLKNILGGVR